MRSEKAEKRNSVSQSGSSAMSTTLGHVTLDVGSHLNFFLKNFYLGGSFGSRFRVEVHFTYLWLGLVIHICSSDETWNASIPFLSILLSP